MIWDLGRLMRTPLRLERTISTSAFTKGSPKSSWYCENRLSSSIIENSSTTRPAPCSVCFEWNNGIGRRRGETECVGVEGGCDDAEVIQETIESGDEAMVEQLGARVGEATEDGGNASGLRLLSRGRGRIGVCGRGAAVEEQSCEDGDSLMNMLAIRRSVPRTIFLRPVPSGPFPSTFPFDSALEPE